MTILTASLGDLSGLRQLERASFGKDAWPLLDLIALLTWPGINRLKFIRSEMMIGFIASDQPVSRDQAWITTLAVLPAYRRQGVARALLVECEQRITAPKIRLCVRITNSPAIQLYSSSGYKQCDIWKNYYEDGGDGLVMEKLRRLHIMKTAQNGY
jgi:ribosomal-protein-alanine N-acetyltransferase